MGNILNKGKKIKKKTKIGTAVQINSKKLLFKGVNLIPQKKKLFLFPIKGILNCNIIKIKNQVTKISTIIKK